MLEIKKYRKKPVEVEAVQVAQRMDGKEIEKWVGDGAEAFDVGMAPGMLHHVFIMSPQGKVKAEVGDWIVKHPTGFYAMKDETFTNGYETLAEQLGDSPAQRAMDGE